MTSVSSEHDFGGEGGSVLTAGAIASLLRGRLVGDPEVVVRGIAPLDRARPEDLSFLATQKYAPLLASSRAGVILVSPALAHAAGGARARVIVDEPHDALLSLIPRLYQAPLRSPGIHPSAVIGRGARIGFEVAIGPNVVIGEGSVVGDRALIEAQCVVGDGVEVGEDARLCPGVTLYSGSRIGRRVIVHAGARIGSDGFGYVFRNGQHEKIPHVGRCLIGDDVEIGANTTIDRGSIDDTVVGAGTKIDNLVHVGHNVRIGRLCLLMAQVGIAGSARIEDGCILAGQVGIAGHSSIGRGARLGAQAGAFGDVPAGETWSGYPARPHKQALRAQAAMFKLPTLLRRIEQLLEGSRGSGP